MEYHPPPTQKNPGSNTMKKNHWRQRDIRKQKDKDYRRSSYINNYTKYNRLNSQKMSWSSRLDEKTQPYKVCLEKVQLSLI